MRRRARARRRGARGLRALGDAGHADRPVTDGRPLARARPRRRGRRPAGQRARRRLPAVRPRARAARRTPLYAAPPRGAARRRVAGETLLALLRLAPTSPRAGRCSSSTTRSSSRARCAGPTRPTPPCWRSPTASAIAVSIDGNGRRVACDPRARRGRGGVRVRRQPRLRRRRAARADQLPELRQPREAARRLAADRGGRRASPRPARRSACPVVGGNVSLYNEAPTGPIFPTPVVGIVGRLPDAARAGRLGFAREGDAIALVGPFAPSLARLGAGQAAGRRAAPAPLPAIDVRRSATRTSAVRDARPLRGAAQRPRHRRGRHRGRRWPSAASPAGSARRSRCPDGLDPFGEAPGRAFVVSGPPSALAGLTVIGEVGGDALALEGLLERRSFRAARRPRARPRRTWSRPTASLGSAGWAWLIS